MNLRPPPARPILAWTIALLFGGATAFAVPTSTATVTAANTPTLRINEVLAANTKIASGTNFPDMIELFNAGITEVDLSRKQLRDQAADPSNPTIFSFPDGTRLAAGRYLIVYADSRTSTASEFHTGFSLDAEGDEVKLYDSPGNGGALIDSVAFGFQISDFSISRTGAGNNVWALTTPTLGAANGSPVALANLAAVRLNEWAGNIVFRLDHDMIELFNPGAQPVAMGGVRMTDDITRTGYRFPSLSFIAPAGFLPLYKGDYLFGLNGDRAVVTLFSENVELIDQVTIIAQPDDRSQGRSPDGAATLATFAIPTPGISNTTPFPAAYQDLLNYLRVTEIMYDPQADSNASQYEFIELQNISPTTTLNLSGVRFTNGVDYEFRAGVTLAPGAFILVCTDRSSFRARYPNVPDSMLAAGSYEGSLANDGDTIALTLPAPWKVHILRFRYESSWVPSTSKGGYSLVPVAPATAKPEDWQQKSSWRASTTLNGNPGAADSTTTPPSGGGPTARLSNLSVRTAMAAEQTLIVGVVVSGGGARSILVRAAGPALAAFGLTNAMADPRLEFYNGSTIVFENNDWPAALASTFASVSAFPFATGSRDAAFVQPIDGARSIQARGTGAGVVLVEAYDTGTGNTPRMVNVSARNRVGSGDDILIAGFNITGTGAKSLLIRAVGPKLAAFGVTGTLTDPKLEIYSEAGVKLSENDNWNASLAPSFDAVGAFQLDAGSRDAALQTSLSPGTYTVQVRGADGGTGEALIEIYEVL